ncbi:G-type lectin S-receptor-like serine/threonine-protein kinase [Melia azedarach]|uniref:G-type lectin S-receptor-like serine/threonine-protein kinase n=1 Tax=Melia azedarach TaxID=155640 RepID=A0ACC1XMI8_MELAZ|nr:G-type lectin S-receptor-like serine/threonine-protein kinase [Melia azedarach]
MILTFFLLFCSTKYPTKPLFGMPKGTTQLQEYQHLSLLLAAFPLKILQAGKIMWDATSVKTVSDAAKLDTSKFVLMATGNNSDYVWQSFKNPTNTILPTQILDSVSMLVSKLTATNFSKGRFELHFSNESLQLVLVAWPSRSIYRCYYSSNTYSANSSESGYQLVINWFSMNQPEFT